ncbi:MAG: folate-binding protein [Rhodocyclaceae bacterium]|nr:folate-binding protein [Rhodocyclaceae bacterium]
MTWHKDRYDSGFRKISFAAMNWNDILTRESLEHLGALDDELRAARQDAIVAPLSELALIRASGEEAGAFLHNLLTNDIKHLLPAQGRRAGLCTAKGRLLATFEIWRENADYLLVLSKDILAATLKKLSMYVLRSKVRLADATPEKALLGLAGPWVEELAQGQAAMSVVETPWGTLLRLSQDHAMLAMSAQEAGSRWETLCRRARPVGMAAWRLVEIAHGIPRITAATQEAFVPQMVNYELPAVGGVSFQKGCYPGQEVVARTHYLGKVKRRMYRARIPRRSISAGAELFTPELGDQHCGALVLVAPAPEGGSECLAVAPTTAKEADAVFLGAPSAADCIRLEFLPLPYAVD